MGGCYPLILIMSHLNSTRGSKISKGLPPLLHPSGRKAALEPVACTQTHLVEASACALGSAATEEELAGLHVHVGLSNISCIILH